MRLWGCWEDLDEHDLKEFIWQDLDSECERYWFFKWFLLLKIQINSKKTWFWKDKSVEVVVKLRRLTIQMQSMISFHIWLFQKNGHIHCKTMFTCWVFPYFVLGSFTLGPMAQATLATPYWCMQFTLVLGEILGLWYA